VFVKVKPDDLKEREHYWHISRLIKEPKLQVHSAIRENINDAKVSRQAIERNSTTRIEARVVRARICYAQADLEGEYILREYVFQVGRVG